MFSKKIVCLANSKKSNGRCIAGKEIISKSWIRPISRSEKGELSLDQISYSDNSLPEVLDIIEVYFEKNIPKSYQPENILIAYKKWQRISKITFFELEKIEDHPENIWLIGEYPDKISSSFFISKKIEESLLLIRPEDFQIEVKKRDPFPNRVGAVLQYKGKKYNLGITDIKIKNTYLNKDEGIYNIKYKDLFLCISLGEEYYSYHYKLIASVIFR